MWEESVRVMDLEGCWDCCCCRRGGNADCFGGRGGGTSEKGLDMATRRERGRIDGEMKGEKREEEGRRGEEVRQLRVALPRHCPQALSP